MRVNATCLFNCVTASHLLQLQDANVRITASLRLTCLRYSWSAKPNIAGACQKGVKKDTCINVCVYKTKLIVANILGLVENRVNSVELRCICARWRLHNKPPHPLVFSQDWKNHVKEFYWLSSHHLTFSILETWQSAVWISELKNILSFFCFPLALLKVYTLIQVAHSLPAHSLTCSYHVSVCFYCVYT